MARRRTPTTEEVATSPAGWRPPEVSIRDQDHLDEMAREGTPALPPPPTMLYTWERRDMLIFEEIRDGWRDWLHGNMTFRAFHTKEAALDDAKQAVEDYEEQMYDEPAMVATWSHVDDDGLPYSDGGVWWVLSDGQEGRIVIHAIQVQP